MLVRRLLCMLLMAGAAVGGGVVNRSIAAETAAARYDFDISAQDLADALTAFGRACNQQIAFDKALVRKTKTPALRGKYTAEEGLTQLLEGSGLTFKRAESGVLVIQRVESGKTSDQGPQSAVTAAGPALAELDEIVVTGTHIRGLTNPTSPVLSYDRSAIENTGYSTTDEFIRSLPQNFAGGSAGASPDGVLGPGNLAQSNNEAGSAVNLRGLGSNATLVLLDGHRMAPSDFGGFVDVSMIPLAAVQRVDVLTDGSSAIYGADAVAGVVNFILRKDYEGAETTARYGTVTRGGMHEELVGQTYGTQWGSGGLIANLQYQHQSSLSASQRSFTNTAAEPTDIYPQYNKYSGVFSIHQTIVSTLSVFADALLSDNVLQRSSTPVAENFNEYVVHNTAPNVTAGFDYDFKQWHLELSDTFSRQGLTVSVPQTNNPQTPDFVPGSKILVNTDRLNSVDLQADGPLFELPTGVVKGAVGASGRSESFESNAPYFPPQSSFSRHVTAEYAELSIPLGQRVQLSAAVRHDNYSDFGGTTNGKYGFAWSPLRELSVRASYGTSFRAPSASELFNQVSGISAFNFPFAAPSGTGTVPVLAVSGVGKELGPETSKNWSAGLEFKPDIIPGGSVSVNYYNIDFTNRIITPPFDTAALQKPGVYGSLISTFPNDAAAAAYVANLIGQGGSFFDIIGTGTTGIRYLYNDETLNAAVVRQSGWDVTANYPFKGVLGAFDWRLNAAVIDKIDTQFTAASSATNLVNTYSNPLKFKLRSDLSWTREAWAANVAGNFSNAYTDTTATPYGRIGSYATFDATLRYAFPMTEGLARGFSIGLSAINIFDRAPPFIVGGIGAPGIHYDVGNADPRGRFVSLDLRKTW